MSDFDGMMALIDGLRAATQKNVLYKDPKTLDEVTQEALKYDSAYFLGSLRQPYGPKTV